VTSELTPTGYRRDVNLVPMNVKNVSHTLHVTCLHTLHVSIEYESMFPLRAGQREWKLGFWFVFKMLCRDDIVNDDMSNDTTIVFYLATSLR